ncbi:prophage pi2 protein 25 [Lactococcus lactis subsp. lactis IO-1]|nr:prophage pi2 protein 25 [Lactococcus lactis subsp. lactis IO-1]
MIVICAIIFKTKKIRNIVQYFAQARSAWAFLYFLLFKSYCLYLVSNSFKIKLYNQYKLFEGGLTHELCRR